MVQFCKRLIDLPNKSQSIRHRDWDPIAVSTVANRFSCALANTPSVSQTVFVCIDKYDRSFLVGDPR